MCDKEDKHTLYSVFNTNDKSKYMTYIEYKCKWDHILHV